MFDLVIKNAQVHTASDSYRADLGIKGGKVHIIASAIPEGGQVLDATGLEVLPGIVDAHTHHGPGADPSIKTDRDFFTGTVASVYGGITTILDFAPQRYGRSLADGIDERMRLAQDRAVVDYGFHVVVVEANQAVYDDIPRMAAEGITSFKVFQTYRHWKDDDEILSILERTQQCGAIVQVHCEPKKALDYLTAKFLREGKRSPIYHVHSRPPLAEAYSTARAIALAELVGAPLYVVHISAGEALEEVRRAKARGLDIQGETCPQYLTLDSGMLDRPGIEGAKFVCTPAIREKGNQGSIWQGVRDGTLSVIASDHVPYNFRGYKDAVKDDFSRIVHGLPACETMGPVVFSEGVHRRGLSLNRFVELFCTNPARIFGIYPQKGTIAVGSDADIVLWDPEKEATVTNALLHQGVDYTPWEGFTVKGFPVTVISRGEVLLQNGELTGAAKPGRGCFLKRKGYRGG